MSFNERYKIVFHKTTPELQDQDRLFCSQTGLVLRPTVSDHITDDDSTINFVLGIIIIIISSMSTTVVGYVSFQNPSNGSWFVQTLCSELERNWHRLEMMQMLTRVCRALAYNYKSYTPSNPATDKLKQISSVTTTLTKAIRFHQP